MSKIEKIICPSILNVDFENLAKEVELLDCAGADIIHNDIMDGTYVPNFGMSLQDIDIVRKHTTKLIDVHMMVQNPGNYVELMAQHGIDIIYIHPDSEIIPTATLSKIRKLGKHPGIVINPGLSLECVKEMFPLVDYVLVMTVNPGFVGQPYMSYVEPKIYELIKYKEKFNFKIIIDGGVDWEILKRLYKKGVEGFILGKQVLFHQKEDYKTIIEKVRKI